MGTGATGILAAVASAFCNGTFGMLSKMDSVQRAKVSPYLFNLWACIGAASSSFAVLLFFELVRPVSGGKCDMVLTGKVMSMEFTAYGLASGALFVTSVANSFLAINLLDSVAVATGVWCGTAMVVSFAFGVANGDTVDSLPLAIAGVILMVLGVASITRVYQKQNEDAHVARGDVLLEEGTGQQSSDAMSHGGARYAASIGGLGAAVAAGLLGGLILAPMQYAPVQGLPFVPSMGFGIALAAPLSLLMQLLFPSGGLGSVQMKAAIPPGLLSGALWNAGNIFSIIATGKVGLALAYPIMQCGLFVAGLWGIVVFHELQGRAYRLKYFASGGVLILGACILSVAKGESQRQQVRQM